MKKELTLSELATRYVNQKITLGALALAFGVAMIALFTFVPYSWKPEHLASSKFITDTLILIAITLLGIVCFIFIAQATNANNPASKIAQSMSAFKSTKERISDKHAFKQWVRQVQQPKDLKDIKERILFGKGIEDLTVLSLSEPEIKALLNTPQRYGDAHYLALSAEQIRVCLDLKHGVNVKFPVPEVYLSAKAVLDDRTPSERLSNEGSKKRNYAMLSIASKVIITLVMSMIFTMFVKDLASETDAAESAGLFTVRMMNLAMSCFTGFLIGGCLNDIDAEYIDLRVEVFEDYLADKGFKPMSVKELARMQYEERNAPLDGDCQNPPAIL